MRFSKYLLLAKYHYSIDLTRVDQKLGIYFEDICAISYITLYYRSYVLAAN